MGNIQTKSKRQGHRVAFSLEAAEAGTVALVGTFNEWDPRRHPMQRKNGGPWKKSVMLSPGVYEYKFWIDGRWVEDPHNAYTRPNPFGTVNSVVAVAAK